MSLRRRKKNINTVVYAPLHMNYAHAHDSKIEIQMLDGIYVVPVMRLPLYIPWQRVSIGIFE